jgi:hypothetical protein
VVGGTATKGQFTQSWALWWAQRFSAYASRTEKTAHRNRHTCKAEEIMLDTRYAQANFFCANGVLGGYRSRGIHAT